MNLCPNTGSPRRTNSQQRQAINSLVEVTNMVIHLPQEAFSVWDVLRDLHTNLREYPTAITSGLKRQTDVPENTTQT